ncbi:HTH-type transcriptional regulator BenM [Aquicella siphonis]|uniref:HTH-type transcriptional regulator BenM n=1 Tax=Aquicella siphonis TaxID=254247 RepID=A0A5E4PF01_9COXI|nr:HTH-type transcriptional regulator BenM [Aquicella siphonis]
MRQFCVIADTGSMTKAAELLCITHSGLSKSMKLLQEELGFSLLRPAGRGLALTEDGVRIYQNAKQFLALEEQLFSATPRVQQKSVRIGTVEVFLLAQCRRLKQSQLDNYNFTLLDLNPGQIEQLIADRQLDYGVTYAPYPMDGVEITEIGKYQLGCYCLKGCFKGMDISDIPFAVPAQGISNNPLGIKERDGWLESVTPRNRKYSVNLLSTGLELVRQGLCAIFIPKFVARNYPDLVELAIPKVQQAKQRAFLIKHKDHPQDSLFKMLKKTITSIVQD